MRKVILAGAAALSMCAATVAYAETSWSPNSGAPVTSLAFKTNLSYADQAATAYASGFIPNVAKPHAQRRSLDAGGIGLILAGVGAVGGVVGAVEAGNANSNASDAKNGVSALQSQVSQLQNQVSQLQDQVSDLSNKISPA